MSHSYSLHRVRVLKGLVEKVYRAFTVSVGDLERFSFVPLYTVHAESYPFSLSSTVNPESSPALFACVALLHSPHLAAAREEECGAAVLFLPSSRRVIVRTGSQRLPIGMTNSL
jgi:hypothetical protein